ncbi:MULTISPECIES: hypothetical protein [Halomonas]|uniref:hypothetical protein n=1 Tax=Halomonas TaxID=2745 RepID=UPI001C94C5D9|nr:MULTISPECIES: hypothetical protein [Halomonas]MBY6208736.1 hypothetical protein [Halomonas sp. DP3Y7-2]MBY6227206.1 hypothetical protein [Halomonas sp. DP3Y7-1]MCA0915044.1 hypothetical protein [Halomonas denitrificans]
MATIEELEQRIYELKVQQDRTVDMLVEVLDANIEMALALRDSNYASTKKRGEDALSSIEAAVEILRQREESLKESPDE